MLFCTVMFSGSQALIFRWPYCEYGSFIITQNIYAYFLIILSVTSLKLIIYIIYCAHKMNNRSITSSMITLAIAGTDSGFNRDKIKMVLTPFVGFCATRCGVVSLYIDTNYQL